MKPESKLAARPYFDERDIPRILDEIERILRSGRLILGPKTTELEQEFAKYVGVKHAVAVSSCSAALEIAYQIAGFTASSDWPSQVVIPTNTFAATAAAAQRAGADVVFCDVDPNTGQFDIAEALRFTADLPLAIVIVHIAGIIPADVEKLVVKCKQNGIILIEDCAHAHGATFDGKRAGSFGDVGCFSFYPTKVMTCGVGGMLTTNRDDIAAEARSLRHHGAGKSLEEIVAFGNDWLMDEMRAVVAMSQLRRLDEMLAHRRTIAAKYTARLAWYDERIGTPVPIPNGSKPSFYKYPVVLPADVNIGAVREVLRTTHGIETGQLYWPPVHLMPAWNRKTMPKSEAILKRRLCLPMHMAMDPNDCYDIVDALANAVRYVSHGSRV